MTFAQFMEEALYGPDGYYARRPRLGGAGGDYFTAPELHPAFGALLGRQVAEVWDALGRRARFDLVEHGPGSGALCRDLLIWARHEAPDLAHAVRYVLVERSDLLRAAQRATLAAHGLLDARITWEEPDLLPPTHLTPPPAEANLTPRPASLAGRGRTGGDTEPPPLREGLGDRFASEDPGARYGCVLANELLDAFPVHLVTVREGRLLERYVTLQGVRPAFVEDVPSTPALARYFADLGLLPGEGCQAEVNLAAVAWAERTAAGLGRGALLLLDYGYPARELYAPHRRHGTLLCYRGHALSSDPLVRVGEQDITSHVDFTSLARAGERAGLTTLGMVNQESFLTNLGLRDYLRLLERASLPAVEHDANRRALVELARPEGLGAVRVLLQARGLPNLRPSGLGGAARPTFAHDAANAARLPLLHPHQMRLPGPLEVEGFADLEAQWRDFWTGREDEDDP